LISLREEAMMMRRSRGLLQPHNKDAKPSSIRPFVLAVLLALIQVILCTGISAAATPSITSLTPTSGAVGVSVTIKGTSFGLSQGTSTVAFNGTPGTPTTWANTSIKVPVPAGATTGDVVVTVNGVPSNGVSFTVLPTPSITSLTPSSGPVGAVVTIAGTNFGATQGTSTVVFNKATAAPTIWSDASIQVPVPAGATTGDVVVTVNGVPSNGVSFTVLPTPSITSLTPTSGAVGVSVTIKGTNFGSSQGTSTVAFNGTPGTPTTWANTSIKVPVPTGATTGYVVVTVNGAPSYVIVSQSTPLPVITWATPITNADTGVLFSWTADTPSYCASSGPGGSSGCVGDTIAFNMVTTSGAAVVSQAAPSVPGELDSPIQPVLQAEDGSFVGTVSTQTGAS
jgi:hypothetical protein